MQRRARILLALLSIAFLPQIYAQDQSAGLQQKLDGLYTLTKMTADASDIVTAGSVLVLHKDGLKMCSIQAKLPITNVYKDGRLAPSVAKWGFEMGMVQSNLPTAQIPTRAFDAGEKFWVSSVTTSKSAIVLRVYSDPYDDVRYYGQIEIPFDKKAMPADDQLLKQLAEVVTVDSGQDQAQQGAPDAAQSQSQDPKDILKNRLSAMFVLTKGKIETGEITKAGSVIELRKDGLVMWPLDSKVPPAYIYKEGKFSMPFMLAANLDAELRAKNPDVNRFTIPKRTFVAGEKFWIVDCKVRDTGVILLFVSDPYQDVRYWGQIWFPFEKKQPIPAADDFVKMIAEVIAVQPPPVQEAAQPAAPAAPSQSMPTPSAAISAPIPPPPAPPKVVTVGQTREEVAAILGQPSKVAVVGKKEIDYYPDMKVIFVDGKVTDIQ